jgi:putative transposase
VNHPPEWFTAAELADMELPGLPTHRVNIARRAERETWTVRRRAASGGGNEYHMDSLPAAARAALLLRQRAAARAARPAADVVAASRKVATPEDWEAKPEAHRTEARRRFDALVSVERLVEGGLGKMEAYRAVADELDESVSTIRNWARLVGAAHKGDWLALLTPKWAGRTVFANYHPEIYQRFRDGWLVSNQPAATVVYERVAGWAEAQGYTMPSLATLKRDIKRKEDPAVVVYEREGEKRLKELFPFLQRDRSVFYAMEALNADGHKLDVGVVWPDGEVVRAILITVQDLYSNKIVGWRLAKSESAHDLGLAFLDACDTHGIPKHLWVDNTLAAASKRMTAGAKGRHRFKDKEGDAIGVLPLLGVEVHFTTPGWGQAKPIERAFGDLANWISKHPRFEGAYLGNSVTNKPHDYGRRVVPVAELEEVVREEITAHNARRGRETRVCGGTLSFDEAFSASFAEHAGEVKFLSPAQRRLLYLVADTVTVRRGGHVELFSGNHYWDERLVPLIGKKVVARYHPTERTLHDSVHLYHINGDYIGEVACYHAAGFNDAEAAKEHARGRREFLKAKKQLAKASRRMDAAEATKGGPAVVPPPVPAATAQGVVGADFRVPSTLDRLPVVPTKGKREAAQDRVSDGLARAAGVLSSKLQRRAG